MIIEDRLAPVKKSSTSRKFSLSAGVAVVLVVDPQTKTIRDYRSAQEIRVYSEGNIELGDVISGYHLDVSELFS